MPRRNPDATPRHLLPLNLIRTETVLSRFPVHSLSKRGTLDVSIRKKGPRGAVLIQWEVSYSSKHGAPGQLAYKLDTLVLNRRIEEAGRPVPSLLRIGSLREIATELGMGGNTNEVRRAFRQNAGAFITMKIAYRTLSGTRKTLQADFTRYNVIFTGEELPDQSKADCVYIYLSEVYRSVLNEVPWRPQDYDYLKNLAPSAQRFYEVMSARFHSMFRRSAEAEGVTIAYSEYCTYAAQVRYFDYDHVKKQMYKVHHPHRLSGYIASVSMHASKDEDGKPDWLMTYAPGPKARNEYEFFNGDGNTVIESKSIEEPKTECDEALLAQLLRRGIDEKQARGILAEAPDSERVMEQLEYGDWRIANSPVETFHNPPGFYLSLLKDNTPLPAGFESSAKRREREEARNRAEAEHVRTLEFEEEYEQYKREQVENYIAQHVSREEHEATIREMERTYALQFKNAAEWPAETLRSVASNAALVEIGKRAPLVSFEKFATMREAAVRAETEHANTKPQQGALVF